LFCRSPGQQTNWRHSTAGNLSRLLYPEKLRCPSEE
jgi:hypothetical protein